MSLSVAGPSHDRLGEFLLLLETTNGRDKVCRVVQFAAKYLKWREEVNQPQRDERLVQMWGNLSVSMSTVRKVLRFFRTVAVLRAFQRSLPSSPSDLTLELSCNLLAKLCLASYFAFDHFMYFQRIGIFNPDPSTFKALNQATEGSWLGEIAFTILEQLLRLHSLSAQQPQVNLVVGGNVIAGVVASSVAAEEQRGRALRSLLRNALDAPIAMHFLGWDWTAKYPHGYFGALGVFSSLISLYDMWPAVIQAPMKRVV
jgi:hypothetical protein